MTNEYGTHSGSRNVVGKLTLHRAKTINQYSFHGESLKTKKVLLLPVRKSLAFERDMSLEMERSLTTAFPVICDVSLIPSGD
jgi:hypothetical protein